MATGQVTPTMHDRIADHFIKKYLDITKLFDELPCVDFDRWDFHISEALPQRKTETPRKWAYRKAAGLRRRYPGIQVKRKNDGRIEVRGEKPEKQLWRQILEDRSFD